MFKGAALKHLQKKQLKDIKIKVPSLSEQLNIVNKLDAAFAEIDKTINITQNNFKSSQIIFSKYLKNIFETKHAGYVSSTIGKTCTIKSGTTVKSNIERTAGKIPYLKVADMNLRGNEKEITTSSRFLDIADVRKNSIIEPGSTIFPKRGGAIATNKKRIVTTPICIDLNIMSVLPKKNIILPKLLWYYFTNLDLKKLGSGSSIPQVNNYDIEPLFISFPNKIEDQDKTVDRINKLYAETNMLKNIYKKKFESLKNLKNSILSEFLNESKTKKIA
jgi:type I restriction enzyme, S subunit